ncbi:DUF6879 family protein [Actinoallomurus sp. CA-142502]|uniref:DUF6879 family protein n=1 Tax=Actinoallomurus sp. CA-142502 TaxID=3239885 RepID=UPI003D8C9AAF
MIPARSLTNTEFGEAIHQFSHTAFRLELQRSYLEPEEAPMFEAFLRGESPKPYTVPELKEWYSSVREHVRQGKRVERVRVQEDPPTDYQRFERSLDYWNQTAGEMMRYLTRERAHEIGLLPAAGNTDWWLLDSSKLVVMHFDDEGHRIKNELIIDPEVVTQAEVWRDLAVHHSVRSSDRTATA